MRLPQPLHARHRRTLHQALATDQREDALVGRGRQVLRTLVALGGDKRHAEHHVGPLEHGRGAEVVPVQTDRLVHEARREMRGEGIRQPAGRRQLGTEQARAEQPDRHLAAHPGHGNHALAGLARTEQRLQLLDLGGKVVGTAQAVAPQRLRSVGVGPRRAAQAQVDAPGIERLEGAELFGHHQRRMVRQHHPAGPDANARSAARQVADQHGRGRAGDAVHVVMLGHPEAREIQCFDMPGQRQRIAQRLCRAAVIANGRKVEGGKANLLDAGHGGPGQRKMILRPCQPRSATATLLAGPGQFAALRVVQSRPGAKAMRAGTQAIMLASAVIGVLQQQLAGTLQRLG